MEIGQDTMAGFAIGLADSTKMIDKALAASVGSIQVPTLAPRSTVGPMRMQAGWEVGGTGITGTGGDIVVNVSNPLPRAEDVADALGWAARRMARA
jgi:hypothetical protein